MKQTVSGFFAFICAWITGLLGLSGCDKVSIGNKNLVCEYGCPHTEFVLKGVVTDEAGNAIQGVKVSMNNVKYPDSSPAFEIYTDENGKALFADEFSSVGAFVDSEYKIILEDVDGPENGGEFATTTIDAELVQTGKGSGEWLVGKYECSFTARMTPSDKE